MRIRKAATVVLAGISVLTLSTVASLAHAGADSQHSPRIISTTTVYEGDAKLVLPKYLKDGQVCQQYIESASETTKRDHALSWSATVNEVCDEPEARPVGNSVELFPKKLLELQTIRYGHLELQDPKLAVSLASEPETLPHWRLKGVWASQ